jgi:hypothetical protein
MNVLLKVVGWGFRVSAAICITWIAVSVISGTNGLTTVPAILGSVAYHAVFALTGSQLVGLANRRKAAEARTAEA